MVNVDQGCVWVRFRLGHHHIICVSVVDVTDLHVIVHTFLVFGFLTTFVTEKHITAPLPPMLLLTGNTLKHLVTGRLAGARDGEELEVPADT